MKRLFNILLYLSFIFLIVYLYNQDYIDTDWKQISLWPLAISVMLFFAGITFSSISWWKSLGVHDIRISKSLAVVSHGLSIFAKYIPGKVWVIMGRATYVSARGHSFTLASVASLKEQLIFVWVGLGVSAIPMFMFYGVDYFSILVMVVFILFSFFIFSEGFNRLIIRILNRILKKDLSIPALSFRSSLSISFYCLVYWSIWMAGFYFLAYSLQDEVSILVVFAFPLSVTLGILAVIFPGGIGVREGIMTGYLVHAGMPVTEAASVSVMARLWFISGEIFIFILAMVLKRKLMKTG